jgi:hypothetical protein
VFGALIERLFSPPEAEEPDPPAQQPVDTPSEAASLFECPACHTVYISAELATCPECETGVEPVETATDLGWTR